MPHPPTLGLTDRLIDALHVEALVLADEARAYFDDAGRADRDRLRPLDRVVFSCESLKVTTRLMHVVAWLLTQRGVEGTKDVRLRRPLGPLVDSDPDSIAALPDIARQLIAASRDLHARVGRLERGTGANDAMPPSPTHALWNRLERAM